MLRALRFVIIAAILLALAWWIGNLPGNVVAHSGSYTVQTSVPAALLLLFIVALLFTILLRVLSGLRRAPGGFGNWRGGRRRRLGEIATQRGLVALAAGDAKGAEAEATRARKLLGETPLVLLLLAESARLSGHGEQAQAAFQKLTAHKDMAFLGHRGLLRHQLAAGNHEQAALHADAAGLAYTGGSWLAAKRQEIALTQQDWPSALSLARNRDEIAALAAAAANASADHRKALAYGKQAVKANPALAPAVIAYAKTLAAVGKQRAARKILLAGWTAAPHPAIAVPYLQSDVTPLARAQDAATLAAAKPGHPESELLLAQTSFAARLTGEARRHAKAAMAAGSIDGRAAAIVAALDAGSETLGPAASAAPGWACTACHTTHEDWQPVCPHCHKAGTLSWPAAAKSVSLTLLPA